MTVNYKQAKELSRYPHAFSHLDRWMVLNTQTGAPVQGAYNEGMAQQAADLMNEHERRNNRAPVYGVQALDKED